MGFRFRRSVKIAPGLRLNIGKKSVGISIGTRGAHVSANNQGRMTASAGIPGTGLSYVETKTLGKERKRTSKSIDEHEEAEFSADTESESAIPVRKRNFLSIPNILITTGILAVFTNPLIGDIFIIAGIGISAYGNWKDWKQN